MEEGQAPDGPREETGHRTSSPASGPLWGTPRLYQILVLASLLVYGVVRLDLEVAHLRAAVLLGTALLTQYVCTRLWRLPAFDPRSALISGLSLCLLLRTDSLAARRRGRAVAHHRQQVRPPLAAASTSSIPTNFGIVALLLADGRRGLGLAGPVGERGASSAS